MQTNEEAKVEERLEDITGITCIYIPVNDVYESVKWYQKNLGFQPTDHNQVKPGMEIAILVFPDQNGMLPAAGIRQVVPAIFLMGGGGGATRAAGSYGFTFDSGDRQPVACFITPRIQEMYNRFKENGVNIVTEIPENRPCGPNFRFSDLEGNLLEIWQP
ncbi:VOC family protein [Paenibacillus spongiae]|uniref:VOC family protein n=1 Tax=Paenibacillus spongiae TaxID=2909671 RepID=A0ABY5S0V4_9BACL|nr:VOC family protein [Paenibacillus spongiae]UVI27274.1 VOC family protein [Paenibacillus spongiae]